MQNSKERKQHNRSNQPVAYIYFSHLTKHNIKQTDGQSHYWLCHSIILDMDALR